MPPVLTSDDGDLVLRPAKYGDGAAHIAHGWSKDIHRMFGGARLSPPADARTMAASWLRSVRMQPYAWVVQQSGRMIGQIRLHSINRTDRRARLSVGLLSEGCLGRGVGRGAIRLVLAHAFDEMRLNRVDLRVLAFNERAIRCYRSCGFVEEGRERQSACIGDMFYDDLIMGVLAEDFAP